MHEDEDHAATLARLGAALGYEVTRIWRPIPPALADDRREARRLIDGGECPDCYQRVGRDELIANAELLASADRDDAWIDEDAWLDVASCAYCIAPRLPLHVVSTLYDLDPPGEPSITGDPVESGEPSKRGPHEIGGPHETGTTSIREPSPPTDPNGPTTTTNGTAMNDETNDHTNDPDRDGDPARPRVEHDPGGCVRTHTTNPLAGGPIVSGFVGSTAPAEWIDPAAWHALAVLTEANAIIDDEHARDVPPELRGERSRE